MDEQLLLGEATIEQLIRELGKRPGLVGVMVVSGIEAFRSDPSKPSLPYQVVKFEGVDYRDAAVLLMSGAATILQQHFPKKA